MNTYLLFLALTCMPKMSCNADQTDERMGLPSNSECAKQQLVRFQAAVQTLQTLIQSEFQKLQSEIESEIEILESHDQPEIETLQANVQALQAKISKLESDATTGAKGAKGAMFTRWGRTSCPANVSSLVYTGSAGGSHYTNPGGAAEYVCMPSDPIWGPNKDDTGTNNAYMFGAEYQYPTSMFVPNGNGMVDVPCAVCMGNRFSTTLMVPGRIQCYPGWMEAYHGNLASGHGNHNAASEYVCVDQEPESLEGSTNVNNEGKLFYGVKAQCGSLKCPPYEDGKYLSCVVCLK